MPGITGEADDGDYATLRGPTGDLLHLSDLTMIDSDINSMEIERRGGHVMSSCDLVDDNTSEEGKLLESVRDDSVTYASTRDLEPPAAPPPPPLHPMSPGGHYIGSPEKIMSPLAPVCVTVHNNEIHVIFNLNKLHFLLIN